MKSLKLLFLVCILTFSSCIDDDDNPSKNEVLPPITQEGKNTFGCLVNGKVWLPKGDFSTPSAISCYYYPRFDFIDEELWGVLQITIDRKSEDESRGWIRVSHVNLLNTGDHTLYLDYKDPDPNYKGGGGDIYIRLITVLGTILLRKILLTG